MNAFETNQTSLEQKMTAFAKQLEVSEIAPISFASSAASDIVALRQNLEKETKKLQEEINPFGESTS